MVLVVEVTLVGSCSRVIRNRARMASGGNGDITPVIQEEQELPEHLAQVTTSPTRGVDYDSDFK